MRLPIALTRSALLLGAAGVLAWSMASPSSSTAQQPTRKLTPSESANHVLSRLAFGARPGQAAAVAKLGWQKWVEQQLHPETIDDSAMDKRLAEWCPSLQLSLTDLQKGSKGGKAKVKDEKLALKHELQDAVLLRAVYSSRQFNEVIVEFWRNHLNVDVNKVPFLATHYEENVLRKHAFSKFEDLLLASAQHPAMLVYLDNYVSNKRGVNENYARELMELHTLGVDNFYMQKDVIALAKTLTGWTCGFQTNQSGVREYRFFYNAADRDESYGAIVGMEHDGLGGVKDGEKIIRHLANHEGTMKFVSTKLCRYLVNDNPSPELVNRAIETWKKTGGDLREIYRSIILSPEFWDYRNYRAKFKTPFEYTVSVLRTTAAQIDSTEQIYRELKLMGQPIYEHEEPTGYSDQREAWLDPGIMVYRWNFAIGIVTEKVKGVKIGTAFVDQVAKPTQAARTKQVMEMVLPGVVDPRTQYQISQSTDLRGMVALAIGSPAYQQQ